MSKTITSSIFIIKGLILVMLFHFLCCFGDRGNTNPNVEKIVFLVATDNCKKICIMDTNGKNVRELLCDYSKRLLSGLAVSNDGKWLAFLKGNHPGTDGGYSSSIINLLNLQNLTVRQIEQSQPFDKSSFSWSSTNNQIVYPDFLGNIYMYDISSDSKKFIFKRGDSLSLSEYIRWSPNGEKIVSVHIGQVIYVFELDQPQLVPINEIDYNILSIDGLNWFNDEEVLYYSNTGGIYKISIASHERFIISTLSTMDIAISPNGEKIIATQEDTSKISGHGMDLYIMDQNGLKHRKLTNKGYNAEPCWSTDGKHIVFTSNRDGRGEIYIMDAEGKNQKRLTFTDEGNSYNPIWISQYRE